jgi:hypothetical protein
MSASEPRFRLTVPVVLIGLAATTAVAVATPLLVTAITALSLYTALLPWLIRAGRREEGFRPSFNNASISRSRPRPPAATDRRAAYSSGPPRSIGRSPLQTSTGPTCENAVAQALGST